MPNVNCAEKGNRNEADELLNFTKSLDRTEQLQLLAFLQGFKMGQLGST